jgi:hypothetical protein
VVVRGSGAPAGDLCRGILRHRHVHAAARRARDYRPVRCRQSRCHAHAAIHTPSTRTRTCGRASQLGRHDLVCVCVCVCVHRGERLGFLSAGAFFGETPILDSSSGGEVRRRTVTAMTDCKLCFLSKNEVHSCASSYPELVSWLPSVGSHAHMAHTMACRDGYILAASTGAAGPARACVQCLHACIHHVPVCYGPQALRLRRCMRTEAKVNKKGRKYKEAMRGACTFAGAPLHSLGLPPSGLPWLNPHIEALWSRFPSASQ